MIDGPDFDRVRRGSPGGPVSRIATALVALVVLANPVLAHGDGGGSGLHTTWLPAAVFAFGLVVLGASVALDAREVVDRTVADAGVIVGVLCVIASIGIYWL